MKALLTTRLAAMMAAFQPDFSVVGYAPAPRGGPKQETGAGAMRAKERLKAKIKANEAIPSGDRMTRQRRRAADRAFFKQSRISPAEFGRRKMASINGWRAA